MDEHVFVPWTFILIYSVCCVDINLTPDTVVLESLTPAQFSITCSVSSGTPVKHVIEMKIQRNTGQTNDRQFQPIADATSFDSTTDAKLVTPIAADIARRNPSASGSVNKENPLESKLTLTFSTSINASIECKDVGQYKCFLSYRDTLSSTITEESTQNLTVVAYPSDITLMAKKNGVVVNYPNGTEQSPAEFQKGDEVELTCEGNVGSDRSTTITWRRTLEASPYFVPYVPTEGTSDDVLLSENAVDCKYSKRAFMKYNVTEDDANRPYTNPLIFQCSVIVNFPGKDQYEIINPPTFYIASNGDSSSTLASLKTTVIYSPVWGSSSTQTTSTEKTIANEPNYVIIAGGVIGGVLVIVVTGLLVYFLVYRPRSKGKSESLMS